MADVVAEEVLERIERLSDEAAAALLESVYAPQVVSPTTADQLAYYRSPSFQALLWNADGTPNTAGRDSLEDQVGPPNLLAIAKALADSGPIAAPAMPAPLAPVIPVATPTPTNTSLALGQMPDPTAVPLLATPGGA